MTSMAANVCALLLFVLVGEVSSARIKPTSEVMSRRHAAHAENRTVERARRAANSLKPDKPAEPPAKEVALSPMALLQSKASEKITAWFQAIPTVTVHATALLSQESHHKTALIVGVTIFLVLFFFCACCCSSRCFGSRKGRGKEQPMTNDALTHQYPWADEVAGPRQKHTFEGRVVYEWDQSPSMITIYIAVPPAITRYDLDIKISSRHLWVGKKEKPPFLKEETYAPISEEASGWRLRSSGELQIFLKKERKAEWPCALLVNSQEYDA